MYDFWCSLKSGNVKSVKNFFPTGVFRLGRFQGETIKMKK